MVTYEALNGMFTFGLLLVAVVTLCMSMKSNRFFIKTYKKKNESADKMWICVLKY